MSLESSSDAEESGSNRLRAILGAPPRSRYARKPKTPARFVEQQSLSSSGTHKTKKAPHEGVPFLFGAPGEIRTPDRLVRRRIRHEPFSFKSVS